MTLADQIAGPNGDILGLYRLLGEGSLGADRGEARRELMMRFQAPEKLRTTLDRLHGAGYRGVVVMSETRLFEAIGHHASKSLPALVPLIPNLQGFMRDAVEHGMVKAGLRRALRVGIFSLAGMGLRGLGRAPALARGDFPAMLQSFIELELADFIRYDPPAVFLQPQMTDTALALRNPRILEAFCEAVRSRTGAQAGLMTQNFGALMAALKTWGLETGAVIAPWNATGAGMRPDADACLHAAKACDFPIWADRAGRPALPAPDEREAYRKSGLIGAVRDDQALWLDA